jgi:hypothetical protein
VTVLAVEGSGLAASEAKKLGVTGLTTVFNTADSYPGSSANILPNLCERMSISQSTSRLFRAIPPERVGLNGEYDHDGLAKRVALEFSKTFESDELEGLQISQRGAVVVLLGTIANQKFLIKLVTAVMQVSGAADVEINGVCVSQPLRFYLEVKPSKEALLNLLHLINHK